MTAAAKLSLGVCEAGGYILFLIVRHREGDGDQAGIQRDAARGEVDALDLDAGDHRADRHELLRVPGIGPKGADAILQARRHGTLRNLGDLQRLGVLANRAAPFILLNGRYPVQQLRLF